MDFQQVSPENRENRRLSRFSFSRQNIINEQSGSALGNLKLKLKSRELQSQQKNLVDIQNVIVKKTEVIEDPFERAIRICQKLLIPLDSEDLEYIHFDVERYHNTYEEMEVLGEGCIGLVRTVKRRRDQCLFAVKIVKTNDEEIVKNMILEFKNLQKIVHHNIVRMYEIFIDWRDGFQETSTVQIIMEKIKGKEMFEVIQQMGYYNEYLARQIFQQILEGIKYLHDRFCCHRDLKPNNILCSEDGLEVKITDFNVSKFSDQYKEFSNINEQGKIEMWTYTGTVAFSAPEIFSGNFYNEKVDMWSAGCILYTMLSGQLPFMADYLDDLIEKINKGVFEFNSDTWQSISDEAKDLIIQMLQIDPEKRFSPEEALYHPWIIGEQPRKQTLQREHLRKNMKKLVTVKSDSSCPQMRKQMRARCYLFGVGEIWKRNSLAEEKDSLLDDLRKVKSFDMRGVVVNFEVVKKEGTNLYTIQMPFADSEDSEDEIEEKKISQRRK